MPVPLPNQEPQVEGTDNFNPTSLPGDFHERVVELEMKIEGRDYKEDESSVVMMISELMGLYSVSATFPNLFAGRD